VSVTRQNETRSLENAFRSKHLTSIAIVLGVLPKLFSYIGIFWRVWGRIEVCTGCWWGNLRERCHWGDKDVDGRIILRWIFRKFEGVVGTGWSWLRIGTGGGHLWVR